MKSSKIIIICSTLLFLLIACAGTNTAVVPTGKQGQWWMNRHAKIVENTKKDNVDLILIGDSITHNWEREDCQECWNTWFAPYNAVNAGISGDRTENVLWRIDHGLLDYCSPKVAVIMIGTNNTDGNHYPSINTAKELAQGIKAICNRVMQKCPDTKILLLGIFPYGYNNNLRNNINKQTNQMISKCADQKRIFYLDIGQIYLNEQGYC